MDEEQAQEATSPDVKEDVEEQTTPEESSTSEEQTPVDAPEGQTEEPKEDGGNRTKNAQSRIRELLEGSKQKDEEIERLRSQTSDENQVSQSPIGRGRFSDQLKGRTEVSPEDLDAAAEQYVAQTANTLVDLKLQPVLQQLQKRELEADVNSVQSTYEELNPDSDNYDASLDQQLAEAYRKYGQGRVSLADYVSEQMQMVSARANKQTSKTNQDLNKAQDDAAIRPGSPRSETPFEELSEAEMEKKLGVVR